jgi:hypothetical protein
MVKQHESVGVGERRRDQAPHALVTPETMGKHHGRLAAA